MCFCCLELSEIKTVFEHGEHCIVCTLGIAPVITVLLLFNNQEEKISSNAKGIDLVVGAKGSPAQLILCNIFHIDFPTGILTWKCRTDF